MANEINNQASNTGNTVDSNGTVNNLVDLLLEKGAADQPIRQDVRNTNNNQPARTGNMVASNGNVYNIVDLLKTINITSGPVTSDVVATSNGSNVQSMIDSLGTEIEGLEEQITTIKNDLGDIGDIQNVMANSFSKLRFVYVKTLLPDEVNKNTFEIDLAPNKDYCLDCKFILSQSNANITAQFSTDGISYDNTTNYSNRASQSSTDSVDIATEVNENSTNFKFNKDGIPSGLVNLYIDVVRGNSYFQPFLRATLEYMTSTGTAEYVEFIGGYKSYGCKKLKISLSNGTFNDLNQIESHIDVYERI